MKNFTDRVAVITGAGSGIGRALALDLAGNLTVTGGLPKPASYQPPPFLSPTVGNGLAVDFLGPNFGKAPRIYTYSINIQRQIGKFLVDADYQGRKAVG